MVKNRFVFEEDGHYLSLAIPEGDRLDEDEHQVTGTGEAQPPATLRPFPATIA